MLGIKFSHKIIVILLFKLSVLAGKPVEYKARTTAGKEVDIKQVPYTVSISIGCTGALIKPQWVLTAAHCFLDVNWKYLTIGLGGADLAKPQYDIKIEKVYVHPKFGTTSVEVVAYDIAVIKLKRPVVLSESTQLLQLEETKWRWWTRRRECTLAGFGDNIYNNTKLHMSRYNFSKGCHCVHSKGIICIVDPQDENDAPCFGDSGGVVVCGNKGVAITSSSLSLNYCTTGDIMAEDDSAEVCKNDFSLFSHIQPNLKWLKDILHNEPDTFLSSTASSLTKNSILHYAIITTSVQLFGLL